VVASNSSSHKRCLLPVYDKRWKMSFIEGSSIHGCCFDIIHGSGDAREESSQRSCVEEVSLFQRSVSYIGHINASFPSKSVLD